MKPTSAEIVVLLLLMAILLVGGLVYETHRHLTVDLVATDRQRIVADQYGELLYAATVGVLVSAFLAIVFVLWPLVRAQSREQGKLHRLTDVLRKRSKEMEQAALTDVLTGLSNRRYFDEALARYLEEFGKVGRPVGLMILDLDRFKSINDTYGHDVGDEVLRAVSCCLKEYTRYHDVVARLGGEEFAVVAPNMDRADLCQFADRLRGAVERLSMDVGNVRLRITVSIGLSVAEAGETAAALYKRADVNLYAAKSGGRNRICA